MASACGGFGLLCWTGIRCGELLVLTPSDFMLESSWLRINKSYQSLRGVDTVTDPKTPKSVRTIVTPAFLRDEMADFIELRDDVAPDERLFAVTKHFLTHEAVDITYRYAHLFPTKQDEMAAALDGARGQEGCRARTAPASAARRWRFSVRPRSTSSYARWPPGAA